HSVSGPRRLPDDLSTARTRPGNCPRRGAGTHSATRFSTPRRGSKTPSEQRHLEETRLLGTYPGAWRGPGTGGRFRTCLELRQQKHERCCFLRRQVALERLGGDDQADVDEVLHDGLPVALRGVLLRLVERVADLLRALRVGFELLRDLA